MLWLEKLSNPEIYFLDVVDFVVTHCCYSIICPVLQNDLLKILTFFLKSLEKEEVWKEFFIVNKYFQY